MDKIYYVIGILTLLAIIVRVSKGFNSKSYYKKTSPRLPGGKYTLFYTDEKGTTRNDNIIYSKLLHSKKYDINGKPDYIYKNKKNGMLLPVELKSGAIGDLLDPRPGDLMQLAAYFLIIEDIFEIRPIKGILIYKDAMFIVRNTNKLKKDTLSIIKDMREMLITGEQEANSNFATCKSCICRNTVCEYCE